MKLHIQHYFNINTFLLKLLLQTDMLIIRPLQENSLLHTGNIFDNYAFQKTHLASLAAQGSHYVKGRAPPDYHLASFKINF